MPTRPAVLVWRDLATTVGAETGLDPAVILSVIQRESDGNTMAVNATSGAAGLMQVIGKWHEKLIQTVAQERNTSYKLSDWALLLHPEIGMRVGARHLAWCVKDCGMVARGLAKYHTGQCTAGDKTDSIGTPTTVYVADIMALIPEYRAALGGKGTTPMAKTFGRVPHPPYIDAIVPKPAGNLQGHTVVAPRKNVGTCIHHWGGRAWTVPPWKSIYQLFTGERLWDALTDYSVMRDGSIVRLNDPRGTRSPYASGGSEGLAGDGPAFVRVLGVTAINGRLVSIEIEGNDEPMTPVQLASAAALVAHWHDQDKVDWDVFPDHPIHGVVTQMQHFEFGKSACPGRGVRGQTDEYQDAARAIMKRYQTGSVQPPVVPPPTPVKPTVPWSAAKDQAFLRDRFGELIRYDASGREIARAHFDPKGLISSAWIQRCDAEDTWPAALTWRPGDDPRVKHAILFSNGWSLLDLGEKKGWLWAGAEND